MTHARDAIVGLAALARSLPDRVRLPKVQASGLYVESIGAPQAAERPPATDVMAALRKRVIDAIRRGDLAVLPPRDIRDSAWLLWDAETAPLAATATGLLDQVTGLARQRASARRSLIEAWLKGFAPKRAGIRETGEALRSIVEAARDDRRVEVWLRADRTFGLFAEAEGPRGLATRLLGDPRPVSDQLKEFGFDEPFRATGGYMHQVFREVLALAPDAIRGQGVSRTNGAEALTRVLEIASFGRSLRFAEPDDRGAVANGLIGAWLREGAEPSGELAISVQRFLLEHLKDPRVHPQNWQAVGKPARDRMLKWLAKASLKAFFDVLGGHKKDASDERWDFRRTFWEAYVDVGAIDEAWLGLARAPAATALQIPELKGTYGQLKGTTSDQAIVIMRIRHLVFCEWSNVGKLHAWSEAMTQAPKLGLAHYEPTDVRGDGLPFPPNADGRGGNAYGDGISHFMSREGYWQASTSGLIQRETGISLEWNDWMPSDYRRSR